MTESIHQDRKKLLIERITTWRYFILIRPFYKNINSCTK